MKKLTARQIVVGLMVIKCLIALVIFKFFFLQSFVRASKTEGNALIKASTLSLWPQLIRVGDSVKTTIEISKILSEEVKINELDSPQHFACAVGGGDVETPYVCYFEGIDSYGHPFKWPKSVPAYKDWPAKHYVPELDKEGTTSVRIALPPDAPMEKSHVYFIITRMKN